MSKKKDLDDMIAQVQAAAAEGRVTFCEELDPSAFPVSFLNGFFADVLDMTYADICFMSTESSCLDFCMDEAAVLVATIERLYKVDVSDIDNLNLQKVLERCYGARLQ